MLLTWLYFLPSVFVLVVGIALAVLIACGGQRIVHRILPARDFVKNNEVAGFIIAVVGTLYAVVLGFVTVVVWQHYDAAQDRLAAETAAAADTWHSSVGLPADVRHSVRQDMLDYAKVMIHKEWPAMRLGRFSTEGDERVMDATSLVGMLTPKNARESNAQVATLTQLTLLHDERARRIQANQSSISWLQWTVLVLGGIVVIGFCYLFWIPETRTHLIMTGAVAVIIASMVILIFELQRPFRSDLGLSSAPWTTYLEHIGLMDDPGSYNPAMGLDAKM